MGAAARVTSRDTKTIRSVGSPIVVTQVRYVGPSDTPRIPRLEIDSLLLEHEWQPFHLCEHRPDVLADDSDEEQLH